MTYADLPELTAKNNLHLFASLAEREQNKLFYLACKNNLRSYRHNRKHNKKYFAFIEYVFGHLDSKEAILREAQKITEKSVSIYSEALNMKEIHQIIKSNFSSSKDPFIVSLIINSELLSARCCPILFYAFNRWLFRMETDLKYTAELLELTFSGIFRSIQYNSEYKNMQKSLIPFNKNGGIFDIFYSELYQTVYKLPKNLAAVKFLAVQEYQAYQYFINTPLREFLVSGVEYEEDHAVLSHRFIEGKSGENFLFEDIILNERQLNSLEHFYDLYKSLHSLLKLDIHPGNFIWSEQEEKWYFIDTGTIPQIGSDYYEFSNFKEYFINIWQKRRENMKNIPIRSLDYSVDLNII